MWNDGQFVSLTVDKCSLTTMLMYDRVKSALVTMGRDGGICREC